jgi:hypothetical protein
MLAEQLNDDQYIKRILQAFIGGRAHLKQAKPFEAECQAVLEWASRAKTEAVLLELVLDGKVYLNWAGDEVRFIPKPDPTLPPSQT